MEGHFMTPPQHETSHSWPQELISRGGLQHNHMPWHDLVVSKSHSALRSLILQAPNAHSWLTRPVPKLAAIRPLLCAHLGTRTPVQPTVGASPPPHPTALAHSPQNHQGLSRSADFISGREPGIETAMHTCDEHNPRQTQCGQHALLPP